MINQEERKTIHYRGNNLVLIEKDTSGLGPGSIVHIDADSDDIFEHQTTIGQNGWYTIGIEVPSEPQTKVETSQSESCYHPYKANEDNQVSDLSLYITSADKSQKSPVETLYAIQDAPENLAAAVPVNLVSPELVFPTKKENLIDLPAEKFPPDVPKHKMIPTEPGICTCTSCGEEDTLMGSSLEGFTHSYTPTEYGVELATGKIRQNFPITNFQTRKLGFSLNLHHVSLMDYNGPWGQSISHSFNMMIIRSDDRTGQIITPDLRCYPIYSEDGIKWKLPCGFFSRLELNREQHRWIMTHFSGLQVEFFEGAINYPGYPMYIREPNKNEMRLEYNPSGTLCNIITDLEQVQTFDYGPEGRINSLTDHIQRNWMMLHDTDGRLVQIKSPATEYADMPASTEITEKELQKVLKKQRRIWSLGYSDDNFPNQIKKITDPRGAISRAFKFDPFGRVNIVRINSKDVVFQYQSGNEDFSLPFPFEPLEKTNLCMSVTDRENNTSVYEIHGPAGGPLNEGGHFINKQGRHLDTKGRFGLRRQLMLTESGKGNKPLRPDEPPFWEQRWLHDCDCLSPAVTAEPFRGNDPEIQFDSQRIPVNYPIDRFIYNSNRQVIRHERTDGTESIITESTYQAHSFGDKGQFSRMLSHTEARGFEDNQIYAGLSFEHIYSYDVFGNKTMHQAPAVTLGVDTTQVIAETWTYNTFGQMLVYTDPNCNLTVNSYFDGPGTGGNINTKGTFGGYLQSVTRGASDSFDAVTNLTTSYKVNPLGMATRMIDPKGFIYDTEYNDLKEATWKTEPPVTLRNGKKVQYETRCIHDGAGNKVLERLKNIDLDGSVPDNSWIDRSRSYDDVNNLLSDRVEVDADEANDLITRYAYDGNDDPAVTQKPEGNREFWLYDERRLPFKLFYGVAPALKLDSPSQPINPTDSSDSSTKDITLSFPTDKRAKTLGDTTFAGLSINTYDARKNKVQHQDGRGNSSFSFFDFSNRQMAFSDQNGNGWMREFDDASNILTESKGAISQETGLITEILERSYMRFDEIGRQYQKVMDIDLDTDESSFLDPDDKKNTSYQTVFDAGSRTIRTVDANGNATFMIYDAADRPVTTTDALGNQQLSTYDANSNVVRINEIELPAPGSVGVKENHTRKMIYDELNRITEEHNLGEENRPIDHVWFFAYDSRNNQRLMQDTENNFILTTFDDNNRPVIMQRFDGDPFAGKPIELLHYETGYDRNSNVIEERALSDVNNRGSIQITRHAFDDLDRKVRTVYPDSDDPIDGSNDGLDRIYDRVEVSYDPNSNPIQVTDQRDVVFSTSFDAGNLLVEQKISLPADVPGINRQTYKYDTLNRTTSARNNYAKVDQDYDALSRPIKETQSIRLDGSGFSKGWEQPVKVVHNYDKQSNRTSYQVVEGRKKELDISHSYDALNRVDSITAAYFQQSMKTIANYIYLGPWRIQQKSLGNGASLRCAYDTKRRVRSHQWNGPNWLLAGFEYDYDRMDNALYESFTHDLGLYDHFQYNERYEVTGVSYRVPGSISPMKPVNTFDYDDVYNRRKATFGGPFDTTVTTDDSYAVKKANEYTQLIRNGEQTTPVHDCAGNAISFPVRPKPGNPNLKDVAASARWDAFNLLFDIDPGGSNPKQDYRYDPFRRRIATLELSDSDISEGSRRYIYDGWTVVEERLFEKDAILAKAPSTLERVYVNGMQIDEPLLAAIDRDGDGKLGDGNEKNIPDPNADQEYYFLNNRLGSIMALLDADNPDRILEYYRYTIFGEPIVLPVPDDAGDELEDTPLDLSDNFGQRSQVPTSEFLNVYLFTSRRFDEKTGLYYYRNRYYEPVNGRFLGRDPIYSSIRVNLYNFVRNNPVNRYDPLGLSDSKASCVECRLQVVYSDSQVIPINKSSLKPIPAALDQISVPEPFLDTDLILSEATISTINLQARVTTKNNPCCCNIPVISRLKVFKEMPDLKEYSVNWEKVKSGITGASKDFLYKSKKPSPREVSTLMHKIVLESVEFKNKKTNPYKQIFRPKLGCKWTTLVQDFNLGKVPTTVGAVVGEVLWSSGNSCKIVGVIGRYFE